MSAPKEGITSKNRAMQFMAYLDVLPTKDAHSTIPITMLGVRGYGGEIISAVVWVTLDKIRMTYRFADGTKVQVTRYQPQTIVPYVAPTGSNVFQVVP